MASNSNPPPRRPIGPLAEIEIVPTRTGARLGLRVRPGAKRSRIEGAHGQALKVSIAAPPDRGKANAELIRLLAAALDLGRADVQVTTGLASRDKTVEMTGLDPEQVRRRLEAAMEQQR